MCACCVLCCVVPLSPTHGSIPGSYLICFPSILRYAPENRVGTLKAQEVGVNASVCPMQMYPTHMPVHTITDVHTYIYIYIYTFIGHTNRHLCRHICGRNSYLSYTSTSSYIVGKRWTPQYNRSWLNQRK